MGVSLPRLLKVVQRSLATTKRGPMKTLVLLLVLILGLGQTAVSAAYWGGTAAAAAALEGLATAPANQSVADRRGDPLTKDYKNKGISGVTRPTKKVETNKLKLMLMLMMGLGQSGTRAP